MTGLLNQELLLQNEYLVENRILRAHLPARLCLSNPERSTLAGIGKRLGRKLLAEVACVAKPHTILAWYTRTPVGAGDRMVGALANLEFRPAVSTVPLLFVLLNQKCEQLCQALLFCCPILLAKHALQHSRA